MPRITIYNVPSTIEKGELKDEIKQQNDILIEDYQLSPVYKFGKRNTQATHWVVECNPSTRKFLLAKKTIVLGWNACNIEERISITQCYKCQGYSHTSLKCQSHPACAHCAGEHDTRTCKEINDSTKLKCILCLRAKLTDTAHKPRDPSRCIAYKRRIEQHVASIDFGDEVVTIAEARVAEEEMDNES